MIAGVEEQLGRRRAARYERLEQRDASDEMKLREAQLYANEQRRDRGDSQLQPDLDSEAWRNVSGIVGMSGKL